MFVIKDIAQERYNLCKQCEHFTLGFMCNRCGCYMKFKVKLVTATCPLNKWV